MENAKTNWKGLALYVVLVNAFAALFGLGYLDFLKPSEPNIIISIGVAVLLIGTGPVLAALIAWKVFGRQNRSFTLLGTWPRGALIIASLPAVVFSVFGYENDFGMNPHLAGGLIGGLLFLYALGEETGWRGFMHDALAPRLFWLRALMITPVWLVWHIWLAESAIGVKDLAIAFAVMFVAAFFLSWLISESRSLIATAGFHYVGNIGFMSNISDMSSSQRLMIAGIAFGLMAITHHFWKRKLLRGET